jgi:hypothetical protein
MTSHKGAADVDSIETNDFEAGDFLTVEAGDWNGTGFSYSANGGGNISIIVVESFNDHLTTIFAHDQLAWRMDGDKSLEFTIDSDGFIEGADVGTWNNPRIKSIEHKAARSGYHKVQAGIEKTRNN